jgi:hypothetical protein
MSTVFGGNYRRMADVIFDKRIAEYGNSHNRLDDNSTGGAGAGAPPLE